MNRDLAGEIGYWVFCTFLVLGLIVVVVGGSALFIGLGIDHVTLFASLIAGLGLLMITLSVHSPGLAWKRFLREPKGIPETNQFDRISLFFLGACLILGGLFYAYTSNLLGLLGPFFIFSIVNRILRW